MTIENCAVGNLYKIYEITTREEIEYNLLIILKPFNSKHKEAFDPEYTIMLLKLVYLLEFDSYPWDKASPESNNK